MGHRLVPALCGVLLVLLCAGTACSRQPDTDLSPEDGRTARSQQVVDDVVAADTNPGCSAAVGERGRVSWEGHRGLAVVEPATPISENTTFNVGSISKQFTALSVAMLAEKGLLSLEDAVADHLTGYPSWATEVTIDQLIHHTSGIPDFVTLMQKQGPWSPEMDATQEDLLDAIAGADELSFEPGSRWVYNDANYLLLGAIIEQITGRSLGAHLQQTFFTPLELAMTLEWPGPADRTRSFRGNSAGQFEIADVPAEAPGPTGIRSSAADLVRWGDVYRTGEVGGSLVTEPEHGAVDGAYEDSAYGLGIMIAPSRILWHGGEVGGFHSIFGVSADREVAIAVTCNNEAIDPYDIAEPLIEIWSPT